MSKIDRDRGAIIRISPEGYRIVMYVDTPGVYFDEKAVRVDNKIAAAAGFDVAADRKAYAKQKLRTNYERQIGTKFAAMEQVMEEALENNPNALEEMEVKEITPGNFGIVIGDVPISETRLTYEEAVTLYTGLTGDDYASDGEDSPDQVNPFMEMSSKEIRAHLKDAEVDVPTGLRMPKLAIFAFENCTMEDVVEETENENTDEDDSDLL